MANEKKYSSHVPVIAQWNSSELREIKKILYNVRTVFSASIEIRKKIDDTTLRTSVYTLHFALLVRAINMILIKLINSNDTWAFESDGLISLA